jgi:hypothetical protein
LKTALVSSVFSPNKTLSINIYDGGPEEGDIISIKVNGYIVLRRHVISKEVKVIKIPLTSKKTVVEIIADGVGTVTTNTAVLEIHDGANTINAMTNLEKGQSTLIHILFKD